MRTFNSPRTIKIHVNLQKPMRKQFNLEATTIPYLPKEACEIKSKFESFVQKQNYFMKL